MKGMKFVLVLLNTHIFDYSFFASCSSFNPINLCFILSSLITGFSENCFLHYWKLFVALFLLMLFEVLEK